MSTKDQRVSPDPFYFGGQGGSAASSEQQQQLQQTETETNRRSSLFSPRSCTSLLITNVSSSAQEEVLLDMFKKHGQIRSINTEDKLQGRVTISYYDLREAEKAMEALSGVHLCGKQLHISYNNRVCSPFLFFFFFSAVSLSRMVGFHFRSVFPLSSIPL